MRGKLLTSCVAAIGLAALTMSAQAANLVTNGGFETTTNGAGQLGFNTNATGWSTTGYNFLFASGTADTTGSNGFYGNLTLWGPNNGSANGLPASSPDGGNFVAADGAFQTAPITQTINGLTKGKTYAVSFYWAGAQQEGFTGPQTEQWVVGLGGAPTQATAVYSNASHGFSGWMKETFDFKADGTSDVLSFLAVGTPTGVPPFSLLDGVSMVAVPEPATWAMMILGVAGIGAMARARRRSTPVAA